MNEVLNKSSFTKSQNMNSPGKQDFEKCKQKLTKLQYIPSKTADFNDWKSKDESKELNQQFMQNEMEKIQSLSFDCEPYFKSRTEREILQNKSQNNFLKCPQVKSLPNKNSSNDKVEDQQIILRGIETKREDQPELYYDLSKKKLSDNRYSLKLFNSQSSIFKEQYFMQDKQSLIDQQYNKVKADITKYKSYFAKFRWNYFFEFTFYHILFYIICGPLSVLIIKRFGKSLPNNLIFSMISLPLFYQTIFFLFTFCSYALYYLMDCPNIYFQAEVMMEIAVVISRCLVIGIKYAMYDPVKIKVIKQHNLTLEEIYSDFYLASWANQTDKIIHDETYFCLRAYDIDPSMFFLEFMCDLDLETIQNDQQYLKDLEKWHSTKPFVSENSTITVPDQASLFGYTIMKEFVVKFKEDNLFIYKYVYYFCQGFGIYKAILPIVFRLIEGKYPSSYQWQEYVIMIGVAWNTRQIYFYCVLQLMYGFLDIKRKVFQQYQLAFMISPRKPRNIDSFKIYPTINIFKIETLKAWQLIRQVCLEYGKSYFLRVQALFSIFFIIMLILITLLGLGTFKVIKLEACFVVIILSDTAFLFLIILMLCYYCSQVNESFQKHQNILRQNKSIIGDIYRNKQKFFKEDYKSHSFIYNIGISKIQQEAKYKSQGNPITYTQELLRDYEDQIQDVKFDSINHPIKLLGIKITFGLIQSVVISLLSIILTFIVNFLNVHSKN
ncbi:transmembrane protein, putative (macronuclear) [Tetrahymena thermophila SB210]|uniref:Transmembrane protein, putative n=1 Tax=Tetrahymena thermophila (strain SB210) TaxID=312017 RepID=W7XDF7_TETTS|nr:transmembrane protein, putative [Tetrahymena thermophila SB210]EWS71846.1 transmembrane protein, putative [Tetrahymena thermophila SB210]|eukprot:XP_012655590.1 transmembrane protein, putative [Tetrahymena thermophila SB210]